jgi:hypothetical protein
MTAGDAADYETQILRMKAETATFEAEAAKLRAEREKLVVEATKLQNEALKVANERWWHPVVVVGGTVAATAAVIRLFMA